MSLQALSSPPTSSQSLQPPPTVTRVVQHAVDGPRQRVEVLHDDDVLVVGVRRDALQLRHADAGADAERDDVDAGLARGQRLGERLRRVVRLAVREDDDDFGVAGAVAVVGVEHLRADGANGGRRVRRAPRVAQVEGVQ